MNPIPLKVSLMKKDTEYQVNFTTTSVTLEG
jgi:hypothetical protein